MCELKQTQTAFLLVNSYLLMNFLLQVPIQLFQLSTKKNRPRFPCALVIDSKCESGESQNFAQLSFQRSLRAFLKGPDRCNSLRGKSLQSGQREALLAKNFPGNRRRAASGTETLNLGNPINWSSEPRGGETGAALSG